MPLIIKDEEIDDFIKEIRDLGLNSMCAKLNEILDDEHIYPPGIASEPFQEVRVKIYTLKRELHEAKKVIKALTQKYNT